MNKAEIRKAASRLRKSLSDEEVHTLSLKLLERFSTLDFSGINTIHLFIPIEEKKEPDTFLLIDWLRIYHPEIKIIVPRADFETALMSHHLFERRDDLLKNKFNILEPQSDLAYTGAVDMVLVPLLAFDSRGYRVGYGKGFYDRFLEGLDTLKVGLSFFENVDIISDTHVNDVRLDLCLTPEKILYFNN